MEPTTLVLIAGIMFGLAAAIKARALKDRKKALARIDRPK